MNFAILLISGSLLAGQAEPTGTSGPDPDHGRTIRSLAACGVAPESIRITYEEELQSDLVRLSDLGGSDEARFRCLRRAVDPSYIVDVSAAPQRETYDAFARRENDKVAKAQARTWLKTAGLLDRVPRFDPRKGTDAFAREVEATCSIRQGTALDAIEDSGLTFRPGFLQKSTGSKTYDQFTCLLQMIAASDADRHDIRLMLVGNEAYSTETPK
jgi:hypothetical protein